MNKTLNEKLNETIQFYFNLKVDLTKKIARIKNDLSISIYNDEKHNISLLTSELLINLDLLNHLNDFLKHLNYIKN